MRSFRENSAPKVLGRLLCFLLQGFVQIVSWWRPTERDVNKYGSGEHSVARYALLWHHTEMISDARWYRTRRIQRNLRTRALKDSDPSEDVKEQFAEESRQDVAIQEALFLGEWIQREISPKFHDGEWPLPDPDNSEEWLGSKYGAEFMKMCRIQHRSALTMKAFAELGYKVLLEQVAGGFFDWILRRVST